MPIGESPCFLGSPGLGRCHLGNSAVSLRDHAVLPWGSACLPGRITCLGNAPGLRGPKPCRVPDCLGKYSTLCLKSTVFQGRLGTACLEEFTPCQWKSAHLLGKPGNCLPGRCCSGKECCLLGRTENCLPEETGDCLPEKLHSPPEKECCLPESLRIACLEDSAMGESAIFLRDLRGSPGS